MMAYVQKPDFVFRRNGRVHLIRRGRQFSRILAAELCESTVVMLDTLCSEVVWRVLATHSIRQFPLHFPFRESPWAMTFQLDSTFNEMNSLLATKSGGTLVLSTTVVLSSSRTWQWNSNDRIACWLTSLRIGEKEAKQCLKHTCSSLCHMSH